MSDTDPRPDWADAQLILVEVRSITRLAMPLATDPNVFADDQGFQWRMDELIEHGKRARIRAVIGAGGNFVLRP